MLPSPKNKQKEIASQFIRLLKDEYIFVGKRRIPFWKMGLLLGICLGVIITFSFLASRSGDLQQSRAATTYALKSGSITPSTVAPGASYIMRCDYGSIIDCIGTKAPSGSCAYSGFEGTAARFACTSGSTQGTFTGQCITVSGTAHSCTNTQTAVGSLTVGTGSDGISPTTPSILTAKAVSVSRINLSWKASTDNVGIAGYEVERCQGSACTAFVRIITLTGTSYANTGLLKNTTYRYRVRARDAAGNVSGYSAIVAAKTHSEKSVLTDPNGPTDSRVWLSPLEGGPRYGPVGFGGPLPRWTFAQWGIGGRENNPAHNIPAQTIDLGNGAWKVGNNFETVQFTPGAPPTYRLQQDSSTLDTGCEFPVGELDLLLGANQSRGIYNSSDPEGFIPDKQIPTLDKLSGLRAKFTMRIISAYHGSRCGPGVDLASTLIGLTFHNEFANQILFYQIVTFDSRNDYSNTSGLWFQTPPHFGVSDTVKTLGGVILVPGGSARAYNLGILARVKKHITNGPSGMDRNINHWKLIGNYYGSITNGSGFIISDHRNIDIVMQGDFGNPPIFGSAEEPRSEEGTTDVPSL